MGCNEHVVCAHWCTSPLELVANLGIVRIRSRFERENGKADFAQAQRSAFANRVTAALLLAKIRLLAANFRWSRARPLPAQRIRSGR